MQRHTMTEIVYLKKAWILGAEPVPLEKKKTLSESYSICSPRSIELKNWQSSGTEQGPEES